MTSIQLGPVSEQMIERLRRLAADNASNVEVEAMKCLEEGLSEREQVEATLRELRQFRQDLGGARLTDDMIRAARDEGRP